MDKMYKERIVQIDARIADLNAHRSMWSKAGSGKMTMQAISEINFLEAEKASILDGTQRKIDMIDNQIKGYQEQKSCFIK